MSPRSIRVRLALWYACTVALLLVLYAAGVFLFVQHSLSAELDRQLRADFEFAEDMLERTADGNLRWRAGHQHEGEEDQAAGRWIDAWSPEGQLLFRNSGLSDPTAPDAAESPHQARIEPGRLPNGPRIRSLSARYPIGGIPAVIRVARSEEPMRHELRELLLGMGLTLPLAVGLAGFGGYLLARRALAPVSKMVERARTITADRLGQRLPIENPEDELGQLAAVFNDTFARLERSFEQLRRFTADASHELRTPLTAIRSVGEVGLRERRSEASYREIIGSMLEEADRLSRLVDSLLTLSRADSGHLKIAPAAVDLAEMAREVVNHLAVLGEDKRQSIVVQADGTVEVQVDHMVLRQAVINLLDNAIKYSPEGATIRVAVRRQPDKAVLEVVDPGPGIETEHTGRVFDRFYRVDKARSRDLGGAGLGLSIARWAVEAHGGRIELESTEGVGSTFRVVLPVSTAARKAGSGF